MMHADQFSVNGMTRPIITLCAGEEAPVFCKISPTGLLRRLFTRSKPRPLAGRLRRGLRADTYARLPHHSALFRNAAEYRGR